MSNFLAIATATEVLRQIVDDAVRVDVSGASAKAVRPNAPDTELPNPGVNVFLYQVTPNVAWRNADVPTRRVNGDLVQRPRAAIDLHYLLSFYGSDAEMEPQRLLGSAIRALHEQPVLARQKIRRVLDTLVLGNPTHPLAEADLDEDPELVKFTPLPLNLEELSKLWSVFFQTPYVLSTAYHASVLLIESRRSPSPSLPVRRRNIYVTTFRQPRIERIEDAQGPDIPIVAGATVRLIGRQLRGAETRVRVGALELTPAAADVTDAQIDVALPLGLRAGVHGVQVTQPIPMGEPPTPHSGFESDVASFVLHPAITAAAANVETEVVDGVTLASADIELTFTPPVEVGQRVALLLNEFQAGPATSARAYRFGAPAWETLDLPPNTTSVAELTVPVAGVAPGSYLVRVQVDGAESLLSADGNGRYNAPQVTL